VGICPQTLEPQRPYTAVVNDPSQSSTATILFTGLAGWGTLRTALGEERAEQLRRVHDDLLTIQVEANSGQVLKRQGDVLVAVFPSAGDALTAAVHIQQAIAAHNRCPTALAELSVRMGLSVGDVSWDGRDCFGTPLVEAARLEAVAEAGQILCSEWVRVMAGTRGGHEFSELGFLELKGLPDPVAVCALRWTPLPEPVSAPLPLPGELAASASGRFVSRSAELRVSERVLTDRARERLAVLWLLGEPGIGKTRLAAEIARRAHAGGAVVLFGRCSEDLSVPYQPFVEALGTFIDQVPAGELAGRLGDAAGDLVRLVPDLGHRLADHAAPGSTGSELDQYRLFEAVRCWLAAAGGDRAVVAVLDDVHWAARPTLQMLGHVARSANPSRALLVCTARNTSPDDNDELAVLAGELERRDVPSYRLELGGLGPEAVAELVERSAGRRLDDRLRAMAVRLHTETAGNPLFVDCLLAAGDQGGELPRTVSETVHRRIRQLPGEAADLLRVASVAGLDFDLAVVAQATGRDELDVLDGLEVAGRAGLVEESGPDRYRFAHALVRSALRDELSRSRRMRLHLRIADATETIHAGALDDHADALAYHFSEAAPVAGVEKAFRYTVAAAERASRMLAHADAAAAYGRALELLPALSDAPPEHRCQLLVAQAEAYDRAGEMQRGREAAEAAFAEARKVGAADELVRAALAFENISFQAPDRTPEQSAAFLKEAQAVLPPGESPRRAVVTATLAQALAFGSRWAEAVEEAKIALAMARRIGDAQALGEVLGRTAFLDTTVEQVGAMTLRVTEILTLAEQLDDDQLRARGLLMKIWSSLQLGDLATCDECLAQYSIVAERMHQPLWADWLTWMRLVRALVVGELDLAERLLAEFGEKLQRWGLEGFEGLLMFVLRREQGRLGAIAPALRTIVQLQPEAAFWRPGLVALYVELGMLAEARDEFARLAADDFAGLAHEDGPTTVLGLTAEACAVLGDADRADQLFALLAPYRGRVVIGYNQVCLGPADRLLAMLADTTGRHQEADVLFDAAIDLCRRMPSPLWLAHCLHDAAAHWAERDPDRAEMMLAEATQLCERHGLAGLHRKLVSSRR
jgi:class 3 adenylate cyclase